MLNWDEYSKEEVTSPPITPEMKEETTAPAAEVQQSEPPQPAEPAVPSEPSTIGEGSRAEAARKAVNDLDENNVKHQFSLAILYSNLGANYLDKGNFDKSYEFF